MNDADKLKLLEEIAEPADYGLKQYLGFAEDNRGSNQKEYDDLLERRRKLHELFPHLEDEHGPYTET